MVSVGQEEYAVSPTDPTFQQQGPPCGLSAEPNLQQVPPPLHVAPPKRYKANTPRAPSPGGTTATS